MDIEFHYYMTYLIAARAGFSPADAAIVAQSAQEIDDNHVVMKVSAGTPYAYTSTLSQTMDILRPHHNKRIYPIFHFIPGDPAAPSARRKDGVTNPWVTTPNSPLANEMLDTALRSGDLYRIGASAHAYADTWAHQNFLGKDDAFNVMPGGSLTDRVEAYISLMRIGHALAGHLPDIPGLIWTDGRSVDETVDNTRRFLDAAHHLYRRLAVFRDPSISPAELDRIASSLVDDLASDIGPSSTAVVALDGVRIRRYRQRALLPEYGGLPIPEYREAKWADAAFNEQRSDLAEEVATYLARNAGLAGDILDFGTAIPCTWKDPASRTQTDWYRFQEAVKSHLDECWGVLTLRLPDLAQ
ncbi:MAG: hypothetical protein ISS15_08790 [Alphaproteobacteria bacterium]|nr:hypothetical protein [Alphaproteobacteria bacterium]